LSGAGPPSDCQRQRDTVRGARLIASLLEIAGRTEIAVGIGAPQREPARGPLWRAADYELAAYPGQVYDDGVGALVEAVMDLPEPITLIGIAPLPNIAEALLSTGIEY
jgi:inosine-uridine nucleoside N-ribohydrolase